MMPHTQHIGLFGSSFNPPHLGHAAIVRDLLHKKTFDALWLVPVFRHPFGKTLIDYAHRLHMLNLLLREFTQHPVKICEIEKELQKPKSYTYDNVVALRAQFPNTQWNIIVGSDVEKTLPQWHNITELKSLAQFYVLPRAGDAARSVYPQISSSQIRTACAQKKSITDLVDPAIEKYIASHALYA